MNLHLDPAAYRPSPPAKKDYGIAFFGCGNIARAAHLRAYTNMGYHVVGACDLVEDNLRQAESQYGVPYTTTDPAELLRRDDIEILDVAVHAQQRRAVFEQILATPPPNLRGILSQKPLAMRYEDGEAIVTMCEQAGIPLMVNQQARWAPAHQAVKQLLDQGLIGHVYSIAHFMRSNQDRPGHWFSLLEHANIVDHGVHYLDLIRHFAAADPVAVTAGATMVPGQHAVTPMCHTIVLTFAPDRALTAFSHFNNITPSPEMHGYDWYLDGTEGSIRMSHQQIQITLKEFPHAQHIHLVQGNWFPEAFGGSMAELMQAITEGRPPLTSGRDNLVTLRMVTAAVESVETQRAFGLR